MPSALRVEAFSPAEPEVMELSGRLDGGTAPSVEEDALLCISSGARRMVLDCGNLFYITGAGLRAFLNVARALEVMQGKLAVCNLQPQVRDMFDACGFRTVIPAFANQNEAIAALSE